MMNSGGTKRYDLEERTLVFAGRVRAFVAQLPKTIPAIEDGRQVIRSSGSIGANYIEANESLGRKDLAMRIRICRKESKESRYWLNLIGSCRNAVLERERAALIQESTELMNIFGAILKKVKE